MKNIATMIVFVLISTLFMVTAHASSHGFVKVDSYTLEGFAGIRQQSGPVSIHQINIPGFGTEADCMEALTDIQNRTYPSTSGSSSTIIGALYASFNGTCHRVRVVVPVDQAAP